MDDEQSVEQVELLPSPSAPERWAWMFAALKHGPQRDKRLAQGGFTDDPLDLDRRATAAYRREAAERALLLNLAIDVLLDKHTRRRR